VGAMRQKETAPAGSDPLQFEERPTPEPGPGRQILAGAEVQAPLDWAAISAPAGQIVLFIIMKLRPGRTLAINAIHGSPMPGMAYGRVYGERTRRSVAIATYRDGVEFLKLATQIPIKPEPASCPLEDAHRALIAPAASKCDGAGGLFQ
jgi:propanol-preferring alcohol dehydrogenase